MKLFVVIYILGQVGATVGPLPYEMDECVRRTAETASKIDPDATTPEGVRGSDLVFKCEYHEHRPILEYGVKR